MWVAGGKIRIPKDVVRLIFHQYVDPVDSIRCLTLCRDVLRCVDVAHLQDRVIRWFARRDHQRPDMDQWTVCDLCQAWLKLRNLEKHLEKHKESTEIRINHAGPVECPDCGVRFPPKDHYVECYGRSVSQYPPRPVSGMTSLDPPWPRKRRRLEHLRDFSPRYQCKRCGQQFRLAAEAFHHGHFYHTDVDTWIVVGLVVVIACTYRWFI